MEIIFADITMHEIPFTPKKINKTMNIYSEHFFGRGIFKGAMKCLANQSDLVREDE
jgi:hypothetical protein